MLSKAFLQRIKRADKPIHQIAWDCGLTPNRLYRITAGVDRPGPNDPRVIKLCQYFNMPICEAFESDAERLQAQSSM
jgi:hypothetical protein